MNTQVCKSPLKMRVQKDQQMNIQVCKMCVQVFKIPLFTSSVSFYMTCDLYVALLVTPCSPCFVLSSCTILFPFFPYNFSSLPFLYMRYCRFSRSFLNQSILNLGLVTFNFWDSLISLDVQSTLNAHCRSQTQNVRDYCLCY